MEMPKNRQLVGEIGRPVQGIEDPAEFRAADGFQTLLGQKS